MISGENDVEVLMSDDGGDALYQLKVAEFSVGHLFDPDPDAPLRLEDAVCLPELGGSMGDLLRDATESTAVSVKTLRKAIADGALICFRPNTKNILVSRRQIQEWMRTWQDPEKRPTSSSDAPARTNVVVLPTRPSTLSRTATTSTAQDAARMILQGLKKPSTTTSSKNTRKR